MVNKLTLSNEYVMQMVNSYINSPALLNPSIISSQAVAQIFSDLKRKFPAVKPHFEYCAKNICWYVIFVSQKKLTISKKNKIRYFCKIRSKKFLFFPADFKIKFIVEDE